jgi:TrpR-related protein YerC/YecD
MEKWDNENSKDLFKAITLLKNIDETKGFLRDLLTEQEIIEFGNRWQAAQMLYNNIAYTKIEKTTGLSSTTIARVVKWLNGGEDGYRLMLKRMNK